MENNYLQAKLEALLFVYGEAVKVRTLAQTLGVKDEEIKSALSALEEGLKAENRGLSLVFMEDRVMLTTKAELGEVFQGVIKDELDSNLTPASLETLAIIAYLGPCSRAEVDFIRGVNSTFILRSLLVRGLIERETDPKRTNAYLYRVTFDFLKHMGLGAPEALPQYERYKELVDSFLRKKEEIKENEASEVKS